MCVFKISDVQIFISNTHISTVDMVNVIVIFQKYPYQNFLVTQNYIRKGSTNMYLFLLKKVIAFLM